MYLGEMTQGKIQKKAILLCGLCISHYETIESLDSYNKNIKKPSTGDNVITDLFGGIFGTGKKL